MSGDAEIRDKATFALGAHSDDLAFSLGAAFWDGRLADCRPVTVFSRSAYRLEAPTGDVTLVTAIRKGEDRRFFSRTRAGTPLWLDHSDAPLRATGRGDTVFTAPLRREEQEAVLRALTDLLPPRATLLAPLALGGHLDHRLVSGAACELLLQGRHDLLFYEDLPYAGFMALAEIEQAVAELSRRLGRALAPRIWASASLPEAKGWAVASYRSQTDAHALDPLLRHARRLGPFAAERVWVPSQVKAGARGG